MGRRESFELTSRFNAGNLRKPQDCGWSDGAGNGCSNADGAAAARCGCNMALFPRGMSNGKDTVGVSPISFSDSSMTQ